MWVKIDDGMALHPKILRAGPIALAIQIRAICYASQNKTDGFIPLAAVPLLTLGLDLSDGTDWATVMTDNRLWDLHDGGYVVHDFLEWNVSKKDRERFLTQKSVAGKKGMKSRYNKEKSTITPVITGVSTPVLTEPYHTTSTSISTSSSNSSLNSSSEFEQFWNVYPRKVGKDAALKVWNKKKNRPPIAQIIAVIQQGKETEQWKKDGGKFIPHPKTWLNQGRWDDQPIEVNGMSDPYGTLAGMKAFLERGVS